MFSQKTKFRIKAKCSNHFLNKLLKHNHTHLSQPSFRLQLLEGRIGTAWELSQEKPLTSPHNKFRAFHYIYNSFRYSVVLASVQRKEAQEEKTQSAKDTNIFRKHFKIKLHGWREKEHHIKTRNYSEVGCHLHFPTTLHQAVLWFFSSQLVCSCMNWITLANSPERIISCCHEQKYKKNPLQSYTVSGRKYGKQTFNEQKP
jgi:hypothetical protein